MLKGRRSGQEKKHLTMRSSSSHPWSMLCKCGEEVLPLTSSTLTNPGKTFWRCPIGTVVKVAISFVGARKKTCKSLEMMRARNAMSWRLQIWNSKLQN
ncbi:hypothetical protein SESBI_47303 [Sesbania bispinosa]|nr:hypothetical protein SESBI_47303 [Sesbania bispinosa]